MSQNKSLLAVTARLAFGALALAVGLDGQQTEPAGPQVPAATGNPAQEMDRARDAQRDFERIRRQHFSRAALSADRCDEHIGRFCLNHDADAGWKPEPEPAEVTRARGWLLATLDSVARVAGDEAWLLGQRVKYRIEADQGAEALALLDGCSISQMWCTALTAFALHESGAYAAAERAFDRLLGVLEPEQRCAWTDVSETLDRRSRARYEDLACGGAARRAFHRSFWHLSDPLWLAPGRERRAEHLARRVRSSLEADVASGYGLPWGDDLGELTVRYGWPAGWDVAWRRVPGVRTERSVQAHRSPDAQLFIVESLFDISGRAGPTWQLDSERPRTGWTPAFGRVRELPHQVAGFRRDGSRLIAAAFAAPPGLEGCVVESGLFLANAFEVLDRAEGQGTLPLTLRETGPSGSATVVGVETRCKDGPGAARMRSTLPATNDLLSDLLLLDSTPELPTSLDEAVLKARRGSVARPGETVAIYWEWYGPPEPEDALAVTLSLTAEEKSLLRKALEWTGLAGRDREEVGIRWSEPSGTGATARAVELQLPDLVPGRYRLTLQVQSERVGTIASSREIVIEP